MPLILLPDDTAWSIEQEELPFDGTRLHMLYAFDITETYRKTLSLQKLQKEVAALNERLANYNQEIVALTTQREILHAKVRIHEELGGILLAMKKLITEGGSPEEFSDLHGRLSRNLFFIRTESPRRELRDEYELIMETAETLGVHIHLEGKLPEQQTRKHIFATAIHECITNTLRHAHGDALFITCTELASPQGACIRAVFTNNGVQPTEEIKEKGGLLSLRKLLEAAGGTMTVRSVPAFSLTVELPKEDDHAKEDPDRG